MFTSVGRKVGWFNLNFVQVTRGKYRCIPANFINQSRVCLCTKGVEDSPVSEMKNVDITQGRQFLFDTYTTVKSMQAAGLPQVQAESLLNLMVQMTQAQLDHMNKNLVTKAQQEIAFQQMMAHIAALRKDMIILEKSEFSQLKHDYQTQHIELQQQKDTLNNELERLKSGVKLDLNLEKARAREDHGVNEKNLAILHNKLEIKLSEVQSDMSRLDSKIDKEIANVLATCERYKNDNLRYLVGAIVSSLTVFLGFYRLWMK